MKTLNQRHMSLGRVNRSKISPLTTWRRCRSPQNAFSSPSHPMPVPRACFPCLISRTFHEPAMIAVPFTDDTRPAEIPPAPRWQTCHHPAGVPDHQQMDHPSRTVATAAGLAVMRSRDTARQSRSNHSGWCPPAVNSPCSCLRRDDGAWIDCHLLHRGSSCRRSQNHHRRADSGRVLCPSSVVGLDGYRPRCWCGVAHIRHLLGAAADGSSGLQYLRRIRHVDWTRRHTWSALRWVRMHEVRSQGGSRACGNIGGPVSRCRW